MGSTCLASLLLVSVTLLASTTDGFYSPGDDVVELDPTNFDRLVVQSVDIWFVEFYASWCGRKCDP